jgi:hypothetical protein
MYELSGKRAIGARAKYRSAAESEANMVAFFKGTKLPIDGAEGVKIFDIEGYEAATNRVWSTDAAGVAQKYKDHPERMASLDESYMNEHDNSAGCAPKNAKHVGRIGRRTAAAGDRPERRDVERSLLSGHLLVGRRVLLRQSSEVRPGRLRGHHAAGRVHDDLGGVD